MSHFPCCLLASCGNILPNFDQSGASESPTHKCLMFRVLRFNGAFEDLRDLRDLRDFKVFRYPIDFKGLKGTYTNLQKSTSKYAHLRNCDYDVMSYISAYYKDIPNSKLC